MKGYQPFSLNPKKKPKPLSLESRGPEMEAAAPDAVTPTATRGDNGQPAPHPGCSGGKGLGFRVLGVGFRVLGVSGCMQGAGLCSRCCFAQRWRLSCLVQSSRHRL